MSPPKDHSQMQKLVCMMCFKKPKVMKNISEKVLNIIKEGVLPDYGSNQWSWLPTSICGGCYIKLFDWKKNSRYLILKYIYKLIKIFSMMQVEPNLCGL